VHALRFIPDSDANRNSKEGHAVAIVIYTPNERKGLSQKDLALLHEHVLHYIQTSPEIRRIISQKRKAFVRIDPRIRRILRSKTDALLKRLKQQATAGAARGGRKKGGRRKK
jgi:hypothetical protein